MTLALLADIATEDLGSFDDMSVGLLILRVIIGVSVAAHGWNKFFGGGKIPGTARWFDSMGMKPNGKIHAVLAAVDRAGRRPDVRPRPADPARRRRPSSG